MSKRILCIVAGCAVVLACVGIAYGAAVKIRSFETFNEGDDADGMAILNYASGQNKTIVQIVISGFTANETYEVNIESPSQTLVPKYSITTDDQGHGTLHLSIAIPGQENDYSDADIFIGFNIGDADPGNDDVRAIGYNPG